MPAVLRGFLDLNDSEDDEERYSRDHGRKQSPRHQQQHRRVHESPGSRQSTERRHEYLGLSGANDDNAINEQQQAVDPPYSLAIVLIIAVNVVVQIILQAVLFSVLQSALRFACWVLVLLFTAATAVYIFAAVAWFGASSYYYELRKWVYTSSMALRWQQ